MFETPPTRPVTPEFSIGSIVPILPHSGCSSSTGKVTRLDDLGKPKRAQCTNRLCRNKAVMIDGRQMQINRQAAKGL